jgi:hypothetical protein
MAEKVNQQNKVLHVRVTGSRNSKQASGTGASKSMKTLTTTANNFTKNHLHKTTE